MARVVLAMSGGVDSSVSAALLRAAGHEVIGVFMRHGQASEAVCAAPSSSAAAASAASSRVALPVVAEPLHRKQGCCTASDAADARRVADRLDIPFYAINFEEEFGQIVDYFVDEYTRGRTPNPCVVCNNWLKFGALADYADSIGAEYIATGHYARIVAADGVNERLALEPGREPQAERGTGTFCSADSAKGASPRRFSNKPAALVRGLDPRKDQSYVLFGIDRALLPRLLFPVGGHEKDAIRRMAEELGLAVAEKPDSQEICFVAGGHYADFVRRRAGGERGGEIVTTAGEVVGQHDGLEQFTVGQRRGLGVALGDRRYVVRIEAESRRVVIGEREELGRRELLARRANWLVDPPSEAFRAEVKIRYLTPAAAGVVEPLSNDAFRVIFDEPQQAIAPGQAAVCYAGERVLGGGWIE